MLLFADYKYLYLLLLIPVLLLGYALLRWLRKRRVKAFGEAELVNALMIREEPPEEKKGRGIPVVGKNPHTTPMLIIDCSRITVVHPNEP